MKNMKQVSLFCPFITFDFFTNSSPLSPVLESESICGGDEDEDKKDKDRDRDRDNKDKDKP